MGKKRRSSPSPSRDNAPKRSRHPSDIMGVLLQYSDKGGCLSNKNPNLVTEHDSDHSRKNGAQRLPTNDDYLFRLKVISSSTDVDDDLFKRAVQGLVKICFPNGILEQLGPIVLQQHLREDGASEHNIEKATAIFRSEMIDRIIWMLAEYLDTPEKMILGIKSTIAAGAKVHGTALGNDILRDTMINLDALRKQIQENSTQHLADGLMVEPFGDLAENNQSKNPALETSSERHRKISDSVQKSKNISHSHLGRQNEIGAHDTNGSTSAHDSTRRKDNLSSSGSQASKRSHKHITSSWRFDVDASTINLDNVSTYFRKTSDLFAFHALPIVKGRMGSSAERKDLRREIQSMMTEMSDCEYDKWSESFCKLRNGDFDMLERPESDSSSNDRERPAATPAPIEVERQPKRSVKSALNAMRHRVIDAEIVSELPHSSNITKREADADSNIVADKLEANLQPNSVTEATTALFRLSTKEGCTALPVGGVNQHVQRIKETSMTSSSIEDIINNRNINTPSTPHSRQNFATRSVLVDLLCPENVDLDTDGRGKVVEGIMNELNRRISDKSVLVTHHDGATRDQTKDDLIAAIWSARPPGVRAAIECKIIPWYIANPSAFPELSGSPVLFSNMMPYMTPITNYLCGARVTVNRSNAEEIRCRIFNALCAREIPLSTICGPWARPIGQEIEQVLRRRSRNAEIHGGILERPLREVVFLHRHKFKDLGSSALVKMWEKETGLKW